MAPWPCYAYVCQLQGQSIYNRHISIYLTGHGLRVSGKYCPKTTSGSKISAQNDSVRKSYKLSYRQQAKVPILTLLSSNGQYLGLIYFKKIPKMRMSEKCHNNNNNNSDNPLTSCRADGGKRDNEQVLSPDAIWKKVFVFRTPILQGCNIFLNV